MTFAEIMDKKQALMERSKSAKTIEELKKAILSYAGRERRFGGR